MSRVLVNNGATLNIFLVFILKKVGKTKSDMLPTNLIITNFCGIATQPFRVLSIELTFGHKMIKIAFFVIDAIMTYNALLGKIHSNRCIPSSLYQYLIMWHLDGLMEVVKVDAKLFVVTSNVINVLLYIEDMGLVTFFGHNNEGHYTNCAMTQRLDKSDD